MISSTLPAPPPLARPPCACTSYLCGKRFIEFNQAAGDHDLAVTFLVMAAEVAIACGDPAEAQLACAAVTQAVDDSDGADDLTLLDQVLTACQP